MTFFYVFGQNFAFKIGGQNLWFKLKRRIFDKISSELELEDDEIPKVAMKLGGTFAKECFITGHFEFWRNQIPISSWIL